MSSTGYGARLEVHIEDGRIGSCDAQLREENERLKAQLASIRRDLECSKAAHRGTVIQAENMLADQNRRMCGFCQEDARERNLKMYMDALNAGVPACSSSS